MRARRSPFLLLALVLCLALIAGTGANANETPTERLNLRRSACVDANDQLFLSPVAGTEASCGNTATITPLNEVVHQVDGAGIPDDYTTVDAVSFVADASRPISGQLTFGSYKGAAANPVGLGGGQMAVDVVLVGDTTTDYVELGRTTLEYTVLPGDPETTSSFSFPIDAAYDGMTFTSFTLTTIVRGAHAMHGFQSYSGTSFFDFPVQPVVEEEPTEEPALQ